MSSTISITLQISVSAPYVMKAILVDEFDCFKVFSFRFLHDNFPSIKRLDGIKTSDRAFTFLKLCEEEMLKWFNYRNNF